MPRDYERAIDKIRFGVRTFLQAADNLPVGCLQRATIEARAAHFTEVAAFLNEGVGKEERAAKRATKRTKKGARKP